MGVLPHMEKAGGQERVRERLAARNQAGLHESDLTWRGGYRVRFPAAREWRLDR